ncbi:MAG: xanthine dehydrogenase family protein molybdopterin-binding subunit [Janthinobacterium lividum]
MKTDYIGKPTTRVDGPLKVTGQAKYAAEHTADGLVYGYVVSSTIASGTIKHINAEAALALPGVLQVFTHENVSGFAWFDKSYKDDDAVDGSPFRPLHDAKIRYSMQPIALVVAETFELARYAASIITVDYKTDEHKTSLEENLSKSIEAPKGKMGFKPPVSRGDAEKAFKAAPVKISAEYIHSAEHHNPMEIFATTVMMEPDGKLTIYDKTQGVTNSLNYVTKVFGLSDKEVRVVSPYMGGGFGSGLRPQYQLFLAVMASLQLKRSVRVSLTRQQMFSFGHRPATVQTISLAADADGTLQSVMHKAYGETSQFENYTEIVVNWSGLLYQCENVKTEYDLVKLNSYTPLDMRAPGAATGIPVLESAMDELAYALKMDPLALRLKNYAEKDQNDKKPFSSKALRSCYEEGAAKFGWDKRSIEPRSMREGNTLIGWGMATGAWDSGQMKAAAKAVLTADGKLTVGSGTSDIGTGTYTIMTQIAAETLGLPLHDVTFKLGDTSLPEAPLQGGSWTATSVGTAVQAVCATIKEKVFKLAKKLDKSPFKSADLDEVTFDDGKIFLKTDSSKTISIADVMKQSGEVSIEEENSTAPNMLHMLEYSFNTHSAVFVEVKVDEDLGTVVVSRVVSAIAGGRIINPKTARSQILGAVVWGISAALEEESVMDNNFGRFMNHNLSEYHVAVNKDINDIEVIFVEEKDDIINSLGAKGLGEIGIVGVAGAITNAVFHATGKRVRQLPITLDKVLGLEKKVELEF